MYQDKYIVNIDNIQPELKTLSIAIDHVVVDENNQVISKIGRDRCAFVPGDFQVVQDYLAQCAPLANTVDILNILQVIWPQEVIDLYHQQQG